MFKKLSLSLLLLSLSTSLMAEKDLLKEFMKNQYSMDFNKETIGLMRNIKVYKYPAWVSKITLQNGKTLFFCSPKSMIEFYNRPAIRPEVGIKKEEDFKEILVTDFTTMKPINAKGAFYVYGSNKTSPAGDDLPAFATYEAAEKFSKNNNGKRVMSFHQIPDALIKLLNGKL